LRIGSEQGFENEVLTGVNYDISIVSKDLINKAESERTRDQSLWWHNYGFPELELGSGLGDFICEIAKYNENKFFVGIDINEERCAQAANKVRAKGLSNVRIVNYEAHAFVSRFVQSNSIAAIHVYFPTPNPTHAGTFKRLISRKLAEEIYRVLMPGGILRVVTDDRPYFAYINRCLGEHSWWYTPWFSPVPQMHHAFRLVNTTAAETYGNNGVYFVQAVK
jgi:tRNA (guanine-N7-)-methyltransferase